MEIKLNVELKGLNQLTEALALIGSALAYKNGMIKTSGEAVNLMLDVTDKVEDDTKDEEIKKGVIKEVVNKVVTNDKTPKKKEVKEEFKHENKVTEGGPVVSIEKVREIFMAKNSKQNTPKLKQILKDHGVKKVTDLEEKDFPSVLKALGEI